VSLSQVKEDDDSGSGSTSEHGTLDTRDDGPEPKMMMQYLQVKWREEEH